jgi:hypothetical protein
LGFLTGAGAFALGGCLGLAGVFTFFGVGGALGFWNSCDAETNLTLHVITGVMPVTIIKASVKNNNFISEVIFNQHANLISTFTIPKFHPEAKPCPIITIKSGF